MKIGKKLAKSHAGFTIIELLMATAVFSVVLMVVTTGIIKIGQSYYKGITQNRTQEATRNAAEDITRSIQLSSGTIKKVTGKNIYCVGNTRYTYQLNKKLTEGGSDYALIYEKITPTTPCDQPYGPDAQEMLGNNMRLLDFAINSADATQQTWEVVVKIGYGDDDLMSHYDNSSNPVGHDNTSGTAANPAVKDAQCKSNIPGSSFCAVAALDTLVKRRLNVD